MDPDARPFWITTEEAWVRFGLALGVENGDPRDPSFVTNKLDGSLNRLWLQDDVEQLAARVTRAPANDTPEQRLQREICDRLHAAVKVRAEEKKEGRRG